MQEQRARLLGLPLLCAPLLLQAQKQSKGGTGRHIDRVPGSTGAVHTTAAAGTEAEQGRHRKAQKQSKGGTGRYIDRVPGSTGAVLPKARKQSKGGMGRRVPGRFWPVFFAPWAIAAADTESEQGR
eukprot:215475-Pelagomonas_calceolata.AAC.1